MERGQSADSSSDVRKGGPDTNVPAATLEDWVLGATLPPARGSFAGTAIRGRLRSNHLPGSTFRGLAAFSTGSCPRSECQTPRSQPTTQVAVGIRFFCLLHSVELLAAYFREAPV